MAISKIDTNAITNDAVTSAKLASGAITHAVLPTGSVLQVVNTSDYVRRKYTEPTVNQWHTNYTAINTTITPISSDSRLLFFVDIFYGGDRQSSGSVFWRVTENGTRVLGLTGDGTYDSFGQNRWNYPNADAGEYTTERASISGGIIDNDTTSARTFNFQYRLQSTMDFSINRDGSDNSDSSQGSHSPSLCSRCTIMEVAN